MANSIETNESTTQGAIQPKKTGTRIQLNQPVYQLLKAHPELKELLIQLGYTRLADPMALNTIGRTMTLSLGASVLGLDYNTVLEKLKEAGYLFSDNAGTIKDLLERLNQGEDPELVRSDFIKNFESVSVDEIMEAEQQLMEEGTPQEDVQQLCDLHSSLFHGKTEEEVMTEEREAAKPWLIQVMEQENRGLEQKLDVLSDLLQSGNLEEKKVRTLLEELKALKKHYQKKWELLMPFLETYGITGPSRVMWGVDDEILKDLAKALRQPVLDRQALLALIQRMREMVYKEEQILFPLAMGHFTLEDWLRAYGDTGQIGYAWIEAPQKWPVGEIYLEEHAWKPEDLVVELPTGSMNLKQLQALFDVLPIDITYIDENDNQIFFTNEGHIFSRPLSAVGRKVYGCHPPQVIPMVKKMLDDFKAGTRSRVERWIPNPDKPVKVVYQAIYDADGKYKGTIEMVQSFENEKDTLFHLETKSRPGQAS